MIKRLNKISPIPLAKILCCMHTVVGIILGITVTITSLMTSEEGGMGAWSLLVFPVLNAGLGFLAGIFIAGSYNVFSQWFGKIEFDIIYVEVYIAVNKQEVNMKEVVKRPRKTVTRVAKNRIEETVITEEFANIQQKIQDVAYDLFCKRGCTHGNDVEDWIEAERIVKGA